MKKLFFGLAFLGSVLMFNQGAKAQESGEPGEGGSFLLSMNVLVW
jgi:hypothetical protein